jgi:phage terminase small subunit
MTKTTRTKAREAIQSKGIAPVLRIPKGSLTAKQRKFAEAIVLEEMTASDAYRTAYNTKGNPATVNPHASRLANSDKIKATIEALERAKELAAYHSSESLRHLVISTLTDIATKEDAKDATRVAAVKVLGTVVGVDAFRETKRIEHVKDSGELREQIMSQLKTMMLGTADAETVDAESLLAELAPIESANENSQDDNPTLSGDALFATGTPLDPLHTIPHEPPHQKMDSHEPSPQFSEHPPLSSETQTPGGDIFGENDGVAK